MGVPAAAHATHSFKKLLEIEAKASGMPDLGLWITPHPTVGKSAEILRTEAEDAIDDIILALTKQQGRSAAGQGALSDVIEIEGRDFLDAVEKFNQRFLKERWSDGLPLIPPTMERVEWMLSGTDRPPGAPVVQARPSGRTVTVEAAAVNAVMAGAIPAYLPIILCALEAWDETPFGWGSVTTTSPAAPLMVIKGPVARQLDINSKSNAAGYGWRANLAIGRTLELVFKTIGGAVPGDTDMAILGDARTVTSTVVAENEDVLRDIGWPSYVETIGFEPDQNVLSIGPAFWGFEELWVKADTPEELLTSLMWEVSIKAREGLMGWGGGLLLLMCPEHARTLAVNGWSRRRVQEYLAEQLPRIWAWPKSHLKKIFPAAWPRAPRDVQDLPEDALITGFSRSPDDYVIFVTGGAGNESQSYRIWQWNKPYGPGFVSKEIKLPAHWDQVLRRTEIVRQPMPRLPW